MHAPFQHRSIHLAITAAAATLLVACGGNGEPSSGPLKAGDLLTLESISGSDAQTRQVHSFRMHAVSSKGELMEAASDDQIPGVLVPLWMPEMGKSATATHAPSPALNELRAFYKALADAKARRDGRLDASTVVAAITDLDDDIATLYADQQRSGLDVDAYLAFYDAFNQNPWFAAQDNAEGQLRTFLEEADEALQGASCPNVQSDRAYYLRKEPCRYRKSASADENAPLWNQAALQDALHSRNGVPALLGRMESLGLDFAELTPIFHAWREASPQNVSLAAFVDHLMTSTKLGPAVSAKSPLKSTAKLCSLDSSGTAALAQIVLMDNNRTLTEADGAWDCLVSAKDLDPSHYAGAQVARSVPSVLSFKKDGQLLAQVTVTQRVHYNGVSPASAYRWLPRITADVETKIFNDALKLSATMAITATNAYESATVKPDAGVWLETQVEPGRLSMLNAPRQSQRIHFSASTGFSR